jgi:SAM-dependent MidA family methyltransferase
MTIAAKILFDEIKGSGPVSFRRFMDVALYHPEAGYYRRSTDPFGKEGDFYTAEQIQPVFGLLMSHHLRQLRESAGNPTEWTVVELGAGRSEMAEFFAEFGYRPVEVGDATPDSMCGAVFANEFFDALPVDVAVRRGDRFRLMRVCVESGSFAWQEAEEVEGKERVYLEAFAQSVEDGGLVEINLAALDWLERVGQFLEHGFVLAIDYGYTSRELVRFPRGTLMSYHRHRAFDDVLRDPGDRDITAHVPFTALEVHAPEAGFTVVRRETLARTILRIGEDDEFGCVLGGVDETELSRRKLQLKTLLFGMGETFQTLLLQKNAGPKK